MARLPANNYPVGPLLPPHYWAPGPPLDTTVGTYYECAGLCARPACSYSNADHSTFCCQLCYETEGKQHHPGCDAHLVEWDKRKVPA